MYEHFSLALTAAASKLEEYYEKTTDSPAYIMAMCSFIFIFFSLISNFSNAVLDPTAVGKMAYFKKNWLEGLHADILACAEKIVRVYFSLLDNLC